MASNYGMVSYFGKVNYDYEGRYLASVTVRHDAASRLAKGNNVDYCLQCRQAGAFQVEVYGSDQSWLADLKLRCFMGYQW